MGRVTHKNFSNGKKNAKILFILYILSYLDSNETAVFFWLDTEIS